MTAREVDRRPGFVPGGQEGPDAVGVGVGLDGLAEGWILGDGDGEFDDLVTNLVVDLGGGKGVYTFGGVRTGMKGEGAPVHAANDGVHRVFDVQEGWGGEEEEEEGVEEGEPPWVEVVRLLGSSVTAG